MKVIPNWQDKNLVCHFCHTRKSVKYIVEIPKLFNYNNRNEYMEVYACNKCVMIREVRK